MKKYFGIVVVLMMGLMVSCQSVEETTKVADKFFSNLQAKNYDEIISHLDERLIEAHPEEWWRNMFTQIEAQLGAIKSFEKQSGGSLSTKNGVTTAKVTYTVNYENAVRTEVIECIELEDGDYKIIGWNWEIKKDEAEESSEEAAE